MLSVRCKLPIAGKKYHRRALRILVVDLAVVEVFPQPLADAEAVLGRHRDVTKVEERVDV